MRNFLKEDFYELKKEKFLIKILILSICFLPLIILTRSAPINILIIINNVFFLYYLFLYKKNFFDFKINYFLIFFWLYLLFNLFTSINIENSLSRTLGFVRYILLASSIFFLFQYKNFKFEKFILTCWLIVFLFTSFDLMYEIILGKNIFNFSSYMPGRLAGFLNKELKIGNYYSAFGLIALSSFYLLFTNKRFYFFILFFLICLFISFKIGERANFFKFIISAFVIFLFIKNIKIIKKTFILLTSILVLIIYTNFDVTMQSRYQNWINVFANTNFFNKFMKETQYGAHYITAASIINDYPYLGVGMRNFSIVCEDQRYYDKEYLYSHHRCSTHPHQLHLEILSNLGLIGYLQFIFFFIFSIFKNFIFFLKNKNLVHLSCITFIFSSVFLPLPSGSFFTTYGAIIFWTVYGLMWSYTRKTIN